MTWMTALMEYSLQVILKYGKGHHPCLYIHVLFRVIIIAKLCVTLTWVTTFCIELVSFPDPTFMRGNGSGDIGAFSWSCAPSRDHMCTNTNLCK